MINIRYQRTITRLDKKVYLISLREGQGRKDRRNGGEDESEEEDAGCCIRLV